jgi:hypothetical protein
MADALHTTRFQLLAIPALLLGIAGNQMRLACSAGLTPWKGGGFGMFATTDGPPRRRIFCEAYDERGQQLLVDLEASPEWAPVCLRLKCFPSHSALESAARALLERTFVPIDAAPRYTAERLRAENPGLEIATAEMPPDFQVLRPSQAGDPPPEWGETRRLSRLRLGVYGMDFDALENRVTLRPLSEIVDFARDTEAGL